MVEFLPGTHETLGSIPSTVRAERAKRLNKITVCHIEHYTLHVARRMVTAHCSPKQILVSVSSRQLRIETGERCRLSASQEEPLKSLLDLWGWVGLTLVALATNKVLSLSHMVLWQTLKTIQAGDNLWRESSHLGSIVRPRN